MNQDSIFYRGAWGVPFPSPNLPNFTALLNTIRTSFS